MFKAIKNLLLIEKQKKIAVIVPWRKTDSRVYFKNLVDKWYRNNLPEADIFYVDSGHEIFNVSASRNLGMAIADDYDVVIVNDADTIPEIDPLFFAIHQCVKTRLIHLPYTEYKFLSEKRTKKFISGVPLEECGSIIINYACSGVLVTTPEAWWRCGGQDEGFVGWGLEDYAFLLAHETLLSNDFIRHEGKVYSFYHSPQTKSGENFEKNIKRFELYKNYKNNYNKMFDFIFDKKIVDDIL